MRVRTYVCARSGALRKQHVCLQIVFATHSRARVFARALSSAFGRVWVCVCVPARVAVCSLAVHMARASSIRYGGKGDGWGGKGGGWGGKGDCSAGNGGSWGPNWDGWGPSASAASWGWDKGKGKGKGDGWGGDCWGGMGDAWNGQGHGWGDSASASTFISGGWGPSASGPCPAPPCTPTASAPPMASASPPETSVPPEDVFQAWFAQQEALQMTELTSRDLQAAWDKQEAEKAGRYENRRTPLTHGGAPPPSGSLAPPQSAGQPPVIQFMLDGNLGAAPHVQKKNK